MPVVPEGSNEGLVETSGIHKGFPKWKSQKPGFVFNFDINLETQE